MSYQGPEGLFPKQMDSEPEHLEEGVFDNSLDAGDVDTETDLARKLKEEEGR